MMHSCHLPDCPDVHHLSLIVAHLCLIGSAPPSCIKAVLPLGASGFACAYAAVGGGVKQRCKVMKKVLKNGV